jgi:uncharacterized protein YuzE
VKINYDPEANAVFISVVESVADGESYYDVEVQDSDIRGTVILSFDRSWFLLGVEVLGARSVLREQTLRDAEPYEPAPPELRRLNGPRTGRTNGPRTGHTRQGRVQDTLRKLAPRDGRRRGMSRWFRRRLHWYSIPAPNKE